MIDALRYEWTRLTTVKTTYWLTAIAGLIVLGVAMLGAWPLSNLLKDTPDRMNNAIFSWLASDFAGLGLVPFVASYLMVVIGVLAMGHEYRYGTIQATLTALPNRVTVLAAKAVVVAIPAVVLALFAILSAAFSAAIFDLPMPDAGAFWQVSLGVVLYLVLFMWWGLAIAAIVRNQVGAVVLAILVPSIFEGVAKIALDLTQALASGNADGGFLTTIAKFLPFDAGTQMFTYSLAQPGDIPVAFEPLGALAGGSVMALFVAVLLALAGWLLARRDA